MKLTSVFVLTSALLGLTPRADACGGCFTVVATASKNAQVITDHRMVLSLASARTTLWDQIRYAGSPDDFVWVLPIAPDADVEIGVADNAFMDALDSLSAPSIHATGRSLCPGSAGTSGSGGYGGGYGGGCGGGSSSRSVDYVPGSSGSGNEMGDASLTPSGEVVGRESAMLLPMGVATVGPYSAEIVQAQGPGGFDDWMGAHNYEVPPATRAAVEHYQSLGFDFLVLRLRPREGIQQMQPVRVSFRGYVPTLPLQMIAAGVADKVGLTLMVLAASGMQAGNFRNAFVYDGSLIFDFATNRSNYRQLFDAALRGGVPAWVTESQEDVTAPMMTDRMPGAHDAGFYPDEHVGFDAGPDVSPSTLLEPWPLATYVVHDHVLRATLLGQPDAGLAASDPYVDRRIAFADLPERPILTRLRTDLDRAVLTHDLSLEPGANWQPQVREVTAVTNLPPCPDAGVTAAPTTSSGRGLFSCTVSVAREPGVGLFGCAALLYGLRRWRRASGATQTRVRASSPP